MSAATLRAGLMGLALVVAAPTIAATTTHLDEKAALETSQRAVGRQVGDHRFVDSRSRAVSLADYRGRPVVVNLIYTSCFQTCPLIVQTVDRAVGIASDALGADSFAVVTIGFDTRADTPDRMRAYARAQGIDRPNWQFLSTDPLTMSRLADDLGFQFVASPSGFDHLTQVSVLDGTGRVYRQVYGDEFPPRMLADPLKDLVLGRGAPLTSLAGLLDRVRLICTVYDPTQDRYRFSYAIFIGLAIGALSLSATGAVIVKAWVGSRRR
jgi:protein SCO1/2